MFRVMVEVPNDVDHVFFLEWEEEAREEAGEGTWEDV